MCHRSFLICICNTEMKICGRLLILKKKNAVLSRKTWTYVFLTLKSVKRSSICLVHEMLLIMELYSNKCVTVTLFSPLLNENEDENGVHLQWNWSAYHLFGNFGKKFGQIILSIAILVQVSDQRCAGLFFQKLS